MSDSIFSKTSLLQVLIFGGVIAIASVLAYPLFKKDPVLKIYSPADVNPELVDESLQNAEGLHSISEFSLINHRDVQVSKSNYEGKIKIVDFFFATCQDICPRMTFQMKRVHDKQLQSKDLVLLSHTVTPKIDTPQALLEYARETEASYPLWHFLTGDVEEIYRLARKDYFACKKDWEGDLGNFIHTENFVLVDKEWRIRGYYDGTSPDDVDRLLKELEILRKEYERKEAERNT